MITCTKNCRIATQRNKNLYYISNRFSFIRRRSSLIIGFEPRPQLVPVHSTIADFTEAFFSGAVIPVVGVFLIVASIGSGMRYYISRKWNLKELSKAKDGENIMRLQRM